MPDVSKIHGYDIKDEIARRELDEIRKKVQQRQPGEFLENVNIGTAENAQPVWLIYSRQGNNGEVIQVFQGIAADGSAIISLYVDGAEKNNLRITPNGIESKYPIPIETGGTGVRTAAEALAKFGGVKKSGDTMTGKLYLANGSAVQTSPTTWASLEFITTEGQKRGEMMISNTNTLHFNVREIGSSFADRYMLPVPTEGKTGDTWYSILTTKNPVSIAQGGFGGKTAEEARTNLGITPANIGAAATAHTHSLSDVGIEIQTGTVDNVSTSGVTVTFEKEFSGIPVVVATGGSEITSVRVRDITTTSCRIVSGVDNNDGVQYVAIYKG